MPSPLRLTPFIGALIDEARERLLLATGIEPERVTAFTLRPHGAARPGWLAKLTVADPSGDFALELFEKESEREAWFRTAHFACGYFSTPSDDPFSRPGAAAWLTAFRAGLEARDRSASPEPAVQAALECLDRFLPFSQLRDDHFRIALPDGGDGRRSAILWLGFGCNQDCGICWQGRRWPSPPVSVFERWLDEMASSGVRSVLLSGGEPTLLPQLPSLVERARRGGMEVTLETNGLRLTEEGLRRSLVAAGVTQLSVSLHAADAGLSDAMTRAPGTQALTVEGIRAWLQEGHDAGIHCVVVRANAVALADHARFVVEAFVEPLRRRSGARPLRRVSYSFPTRPFDRAVLRDGTVRVDEVRAPLSAAIRILRKAGVEANWAGTSGFPLCAFDGLTEEIRSLPGTGPGPHGGFGFGPSCEACRARPVCRGVPDSYLDVHGGQGLVPV